MNDSMINATPIKVAVLDDHPLIRSAFEYSLQNSPEMVLVASCATRQEMIALMKQQEVDVLVLDYLLSDTDADGLVMVRFFRNHYPELKILVSSSVESPAIVQLVMRAGVKGFIGKSKNFAEVTLAIQTVATGKNYLSKDMQHNLDKSTEPDRSMVPYIQPRETVQDFTVLIRSLTPREIEVVRCYLDGMSLKQISEKFMRHIKTISGQKQSAIRKLGLRSDAELFKFKDSLK